NGTALLAKRVNRTPTAFLRILIPTNKVEVEEQATEDEPVAGYTSINFHFLKEDFAQAVDRARQIFQVPLPMKKTDGEEAQDPETRLNLEMKDALGILPSDGAAQPVVIALVGDLDEKQALATLEREFSSLPGSKRPSFPPLRVKEPLRNIRLQGKPQSQL